MTVTENKNPKPSTHFTIDDQMLLLLYGKPTKAETISALQQIKSTLTPEETDLNQMVHHLMEQLHQITEEDFASIDLFAPPDHDN